MTNKNNATLKLTQIALLGALIVLMALTPLGYLKIGPLSITFLTVPVVIGAILIGPAGGAVLGGIFGLTSFFQCLGVDQFGVALFGINPFYTAVVCIIPRILIGVFSGLLYKALDKTNTHPAVSYALSGLLGTVTNTVFFVGGLILLFGNTEYIKTTLGDSAWKVISVLVTTNSLIEMIVCTILITAVSRSCVEIMRRRGK